MPDDSVCAIASCHQLSFTVYDLFLFLAQAALQQWSGYRDGERRMETCGLASVDHSTISKKAKDVPFELFKKLLHRLLQRCNRSTRRKLRIPKPLLVVDSTLVTAGLPRLPWAHVQRDTAGVKLHVALIADEGRLHQVTETVGDRPDLDSVENVRNADCILVADRAYAKHDHFDHYEKQRQSFVIRIRDNSTFHEPVQRKRKRRFSGTIEEDLTCQIGKKEEIRTKNRFRVVLLTDPKGKPVILATNLHKPSAERIAEIYRKRWQIEVFFRWIKQHLNVPKLFGTTPNAVYGQLYVALIVYVLLKYVFDHVNNKVHPSARLSFAEFARLFELNDMPCEWKVFLAHYFLLPPPIFR